MILKIKQIGRYFLLNLRRRKQIQNKDFSLLSNNCVAGLILNDLNQKFNTPTINLFINAEDYILFLEDLDYYLQCDLKEIFIKDLNYPIGKLDNLTIHFMHYKNFEDAKQKWETRKRRIKKDNLYIIMCERDGCNLDIMHRFDRLPYQNKILFTHREYSNIKSSFYIKGFESNEEIGNIVNYSSKLGIYKFYDQFDFIKWINKSIRA